MSNFGILILREKAGACVTPHKSLGSLKSALCKAWDNLDDDYLRATCDAFMKRLKLCINAQGGFLEV
ncbi:unnamed protein product, partial [Mesorhabditis belari]|uniref:Uncharacterized protein n=1 Tax=Mesorhabditis belari TaxID=2138241 RepID=A0AAF3J760_9BILA